MEENMPTKIINTEVDLKEFLESNLYKDLILFVVNCQNSIKSKKFSDTPILERFKIFTEYFDKLENILKETPPVNDKMRFGNIAFKTFHNKALPINLEYSKKILLDLGYNNENLENLSNELKFYLNECFGSEVRIDYGTGHELNFFVFLFCLYLLKLIKNDEFEFLVRNVFYKYISLMRKIQLQYNLEPAGSHGVWGLDDYHFLPFLFGASELIDNEIVKDPSYIHKDDIINNFSEEYIYLDCIKFIKKVKTGGRFFETSPILNDISNAPNWLKITNGMVKMYHGEVFAKFPVTRHLRFGKIFNYKTYEKNH